MGSKREKISQFARVVESIARPFFSLVEFLLPIIISQCRFIYSAYSKLPHDAVAVLIGIVFCFFGGLYPTLFSAAQAAKHSGLSTLRVGLGDLANEAIFIIEESKKDDDKDDDGDGVKYVKQISSREFALRKAKLVMQKLNPEKVDKAIASMYTVWLAVAAVLKIKFARTINFALGIADFIKKPCDLLLAPIIQIIVPNQYDRWVPVVLGWMAKSIGISIAWYVTTIIFAATSAMQGGLMISRALLRICRKRGMRWVPPHDKTVVDEVIAYLLAGAGFYFQYSLGFDVPFPFNWILWPFEVTEAYIRWTITT